MCIDIYLLCLLGLLDLFCDIMEFKDAIQCECGYEKMTLRQAEPRATHSGEFYHICTWEFHHRNQFYWCDYYHGEHHKTKFSKSNRSTPTKQTFAYFIN